MDFKLHRFLLAFSLQILTFSSASLLAQSITAGPVVGGVSPVSARMYVETSVPTGFLIELDTDSLFSNPLSFSGSTVFAPYRSAITELPGLSPDTPYYYRILFGATVDPRSGSFRTFPPQGQAGHYKMVVGSCNYFPNPQLFGHIRDFEPALFIHLGDWLWPPNPLGNDLFLFPNKAAQSFAMRYEDSMMKQFVLPNCPVEYVYDDDISYNDSEGWTIPNTGYSVNPFTGAVTNYFNSTPINPAIREGAIKGYFDYFPGYQAVDTSVGIHHSFRFGNVEVFMLDLRNSRTPKNDAFVYDSTLQKWAFLPDSNHTMMGFSQRDWLLDGLRNSTADWKIIGSSVTFNKTFAGLIQTAMLVQNSQFAFAGRQGTGGTLASDLAYNWAGFPLDQKAVLDLKNIEGIKDILVLSGDSHSSVLDDGTNAGLPELQASGLASQDEGYFNFYVDSIRSVLGLPPVIEEMWNGGGNGVSNTNFSDSYGTVEIFGSDSLRLCAVDELGQNMGCITLFHSSLGVGLNSRPGLGGLIKVIYPNPARDKVEVLFQNGYVPGAEDDCLLLDLQGRLIDKRESSDLLKGLLTFDLSRLSPGTYLIQYRGTHKGKPIEESRKIVID